jgi:hypothetical protein
MKKNFLRYFLIAVGIQLAVCGIAVVSTWIFPRLEFLLTILFFAYSPTTYLVWLLGRFPGESAIVYPILFGVPLGILLYSFLFALGLSRLQKAAR